MDACRTNRAVLLVKITTILPCLWLLLGSAGALTNPLGLDFGPQLFAQDYFSPSDSISKRASHAPNINSPQFNNPHALGRFEANVYRTQNFQVSAPTVALAQAVGDHAERFRAELAQQWLGRTLPDWDRPCPIQVIPSNQAHGETSFLLAEDGSSPPSDWEMKIYGPSDRLLDSVLPHEVTHTVFATHFRARLPRWADEGACTTIEHASEREKIQSLLLRFLSPQQRQGLPFNRMFPMRDYPEDMLPLYAQGYSVAKFLIAQGGHRQFVSLIERGLQFEKSLPATLAWDRAMHEIYGYQDLSELQLDWLQWVAEGSQEQQAYVRAVTREAARTGNEVRLVTANEPERLGTSSMQGLAPMPIPAGASNQVSPNYYVQQMQSKPSAPVPAERSAASVANTTHVELAPMLPGSASQPLHRTDSTILMPRRLR